MRSPDQLGEEDDVSNRHPYTPPSASDPASYCYVDTDEMMRIAQEMYSVVPHKVSLECVRVCVCVCVHVRTCVCACVRVHVRTCVCMHV